MDPVTVIAAMNIVVCAPLGMQIGRPRDNATQGLLLGLFLGPIGLLLAAVIDRRAECQSCGTRLAYRRPICPGCRQHVPWPKN